MFSTSLSLSKESITLRQVGRARSPVTLPLDVIARVEISRPYDPMLTIETTSGQRVTIGPWTHLTAKRKMKVLQDVARAL